MNRIAAIVVTYNRKALLRACVEALLRQTAAADIWVIDNASTDGTREALDGWIRSGEITYRNTGSNLGGAGGFHFGMKCAVREGYDLVWIMDDDTVPSPTALEALLRAGEGLGGYGFLSSHAKWTDGSVCRMNVQRDLRMHNLSDFSGAAIPCGAATFVSLLVPARVVREVGLPIREFFIWADDLEYTRRISRRYPCYVIPASIVEHRCKENINGNIAIDSEDRIDRYRYAYRNEVYLYKREGLRGYLHLLLRTPAHILRVLRRSPNRKGKRIGVILSATLRGFAFHPKIEFAEEGES